MPPGRTSGGSSTPAGFRRHAYPLRKSYDFEGGASGIQPRPSPQPATETPHRENRGINSPVAGAACTRLRRVHGGRMPALPEQFLTCGSPPQPRPLPQWRPSQRSCASLGALPISSDRAGTARPVQGPRCRGRLYAAAPRTWRAHACAARTIPYLRLSATATATATVAPTMGLLPMPRKPIIST